ncbi:hypothetical protein JF540_22865 [Salipiger thiooxidans]|uniref:hypothetical protein n=1 Tax=Salipiger thiooxidans TaxID=282683 RepID=UPI001A8F199B|nr:hypothetical protein [Salipiger thiooxidans]MBN8189532.1 hypothetical protein [Salipiger thiooxidans]
MTTGNHIPEQGFETNAYRRALAWWAPRLNVEAYFSAAGAQVGPLGGKGSPKYKMAFYGAAEQKGAE